MAVSHSPLASENMNMPHVQAPVGRVFPHCGINGSGGQRDDGGEHVQHKRTDENGFVADLVGESC